MDSLELSKIVGVGCAGLLAYVGLGEIFGALMPSHHMDEPAYSVEVIEASVGEAEEAIPLSTLLAEADIEKGGKVFKKCSSCHKMEDGANGTGPHLWNVMGRDIASVSGFGYSGALQEKDGAWNWEDMNAFLTKPKDWAPGTKMSFAGLRKDTDRAALMLWLNQQSGVPIALPEAE